MTKKKMEKIEMALCTGKKYPPGTTARDLASMKFRFMARNTALHLAASTGMLPNDTTMHDLANASNDWGQNALFYAGFMRFGAGIPPVGDQLAEFYHEHLKNQFMMVLNNTQATDKKELGLICKRLSEIYPLETREWAKREQLRLDGISSTSQSNQRTKGGRRGILGATKSKSRQS